MAKIVPTFADNTGATHETAEDAVAADLTIILGRIGSEGGLTGAIAKVLIEKRPEIEACFADLDKMNKRPGNFR